MLSDAFQVKNRRMGFESVEMKEYFQKMRGGGPRKLTRKPLSEIFFAWVGGFVGIYAVWWLNNFIGIPERCQYVPDRFVRRVCRADLRRADG